MRVYTVHLRRHGLIPDQDLVLVREGFSFWAFLFTFVWALWHCMWWTALGLFIVMMAAGLGAETLLGSGLGSFAVTLALALAIGYLAGDLRCRDLQARGFAEVGVVAAPDADAALFRFLDQQPALARDILGSGSDARLSRAPAP